jgi:hypothetical protein
MANFGTSRFFNTLPSGGGLSFYDITIDDNSGTPVSVSFTTLPLNLVELSMKQKANKDSLRL